MGNNADSHDPPDGVTAPQPDVDIFERPSAARSEGQLYAPPKTLPPTTDHRTIEVETVKLAEDLDPRRAATLRRMRPVAPPAPAPSAAAPRRARWIVAAVLVVAAAAAYLAVTRLRSSIEPLPDPGVAGPARNPAARSGASSAQARPVPSPTLHPTQSPAAPAPGASTAQGSNGATSGAPRDTAPHQPPAAPASKPTSASTQGNQPLF